MLNDVLDTTPAQSDATAAATQAETVSGSTDTQAPAPIADVDYSVEQVEDKLHEEWGSDYDLKYQDASEAVAHFFKNDDESLQWFSRRIGNHPMAVKLALRLAAIYSGNGMPAPPTPPAMNKSLDDALADFQPGGKKYDRWLGGDTKLNEQRIVAYRKRWPEKSKSSERKTNVRIF